MLGWRTSFKMWISRITRVMSAWSLIFSFSRILIATFSMVNWCIPSLTLPKVPDPIVLPTQTVMKKFEPTYQQGSYQLIYYLSGSFVHLEQPTRYGSLSSLTFTWIQWEWLSRRLIAFHAQSCSSCLYLSCWLLRELRHCLGHLHLNMITWHSLFRSKSSVFQMSKSLSVFKYQIMNY